MKQGQYNFVKRSRISEVLGFRPTYLNWEIAFQEGKVPRIQINGIDHFDLNSAVTAMYDFYNKQTATYKQMYETNNHNKKYKNLVEVYGEKARLSKIALDKVII